MKNGTLHFNNLTCLHKMSVLGKLGAFTYPLRIKLSRLTGIGIDITSNKMKERPPVSFYTLHATTNTGREISFDQFKNKKVLLVNVASQCGYTPQYAELERLHRENKDIVILGFPANNFGSQEPGNDKEIAQFCQVNYGVTFQLFKKADVTGKDKQPVYQWLTEPDKNGWNSEEPQWNFYKYLVDENGTLMNVFSSSVSPLDIL
ncbi:MAG TPA: glutathione peroxidase [Chitinophagaceae bacterium]|nr:glutathione peroxidase [Chitinophagaceae bacterium]